MVKKNTTNNKKADLLSEIKASGGGGYTSRRFVQFVGNLKLTRVLCRFLFCNHSHTTIWFRASTKNVSFFFGFASCWDFIFDGCIFFSILQRKLQLINLFMTVMWSGWRKVMVCARFSIVEIRVYSQVHRTSWFSHSGTPPPPKKRNRNATQVDPVDG